VFFPIGSNDITNAGRRLLQDIADRMKGRPRMHVTLIGHTDDAGSAEFNIALAQRRVDTVSSELISLGVSVRQIRRISYGDEAGGGLSCSTEACRQQKRRVELRVSDD
jgi:peptidoglycan-associated lipoprotein